MKKLKIALIGYILLISNQIISQVQIVNLNTGVYGGNTTGGGGLIPVGTIDDTWSVQFPAGGSFQNTYSSSNSLWNVGSNANFTCGRWISPETINYPAVTNVPGCITCSTLTPNGTYIYRMSFTPNSTCRVKKAKIVFSWTQADNELTKFEVNSSFVHNYPVSGYTQIPDFANAAWNPATPYTVNLSPTDIIIGATNTIDFYVENYNTIINGVQRWTQTGLALCAYLEIEYENNLAPSISGPTYFCENQQISVTGSAGPGVTATSYQWQIQECNSAGVPINQPANNWVSSVFSGAPTGYHFPFLDFIHCNKWYLLKLIVSSDCETNVTATKVVYIRCKPPIAVTTNTICKGQCSEVSVVNPDPTYSYTIWIPPNGNGFGVSTFTACPDITTSYTIDVFDPSTGCSNSAISILYVDVIDPAFNLYVNNTNPGYMQLSATPVQTSGYPASVIAAYTVEELNSSGTPVYTQSGPACWATFPSVMTENFGGFLGLTPTFNGSCLPANGQFKYNTDYRITRVISSNFCLKRSAKITIKSTGAKPGALITSTEEVIETIENSSEYAVKIYPSPNNGIFTISSPTILDGGKIVISDMLGRIVQTSDTSQSTNQINLESQENGVYFVSIYSQNKLITTEKVIIQK